MVIPQPKTGFLNPSQAEQELELLIRQPAAKELRPCPYCRLPCESAHPAHCAVTCDATCDNAPYALSSEPEQHPIERRVVKLVFELNSLRLLQTCWSCEGHLNARGELWKLPQVSFYAASPLYPKLLAAYLSRLKHQSQLHYPWRVGMVDFGQTWGPTYLLEPATTYYTEPIQLDRLQEDLHRIGDDLAERMKQEAQQMLFSVRHKATG